MMMLASTVIVARFKPVDKKEKKHGRCRTNEFNLF